MFNRQVTVSTGLTALFLVATVGSASCSGLTSMVEQMRSGKVKLAEVNAEKENLTAQNERDLKEYTAYSESFGQLAAKKQSMVDNFKKDIAARIGSANAMVEAWNARCDANRVGELPEPAFKSCQAEKARLEPTVTAIVSAVDRDTESFEKNQLAPMEDIFKRQKTAMDGLDTRIKGRFEKWLKVKELSDEMTARLANLRSALVEACSTATTIESIKHCNAIGWDGARMDLPPLQ
ncbi:MAG: hypothetical protein HXX17_01980 [Geobacteraceae bacterium]|nr:hypothetical protein [Geobacteraceae bacterium]